MFACQEIVVTDRGPVATFDLSAVQLAAIDAALEAHRIAGYAQRSLEVDDVLALAKLRDVTEQVTPLAAAGAHGTLRVDTDGVRALGHAIAGYLVARDGDGYQPPELRERIAVLDTLTGELFDLAQALEAARRAAAD